MPTPEQLDRLNPIDRVEFDLAQVKRWCVTWPNGDTEIIEGHGMIVTSGVAFFRWDYLGQHRLINLQQVRDIAELPAGEEL
jgi:hypothetical protein